MQELAVVAEELGHSEADGGWSKVFQRGTRQRHRRYEHAREALRSRVP